MTLLRRRQVVSSAAKQYFEISDLGVSASNLLLWMDGDDDRRATFAGANMTELTSKEGNNYLYQVPAPVQSAINFQDFGFGRNYITNGYISTITQLFDLSRLDHGGLIVVVLGRKDPLQNIGYLFDNGTATAPRVFAYLQDSNTRLFFNFGNGKVVTRTAVQNAQWHLYSFDYTGGGSELKIDNIGSADAIIESSNWGATNRLAGNTLAARADTYNAPLGAGGIAQFMVLKGSTPNAEINALNTFFQNNYGSIIGTT